MSTRDVLEKIMRGKKSAKQAFEDFCMQENVNGIIVFTANEPVILLKDELANKFRKGGSKGNGIVLTTGNMQFYKGYSSIEYSILDGIKLLQAKYNIVIENGSKWYGSNIEAPYSIVESIHAYDKKGKEDEPSKVEIVNSVMNPVNVNVVNDDIDDEDINDDYDEEEFLNEEDDDD